MTFRFEKLTIKAKEAVVAAQNLATERGNPQVESVHLLSALLDESDGIVKPLLDKIGVQISRLRGTLQADDRLPKMAGGSAPTAGQELTRVFNGAAEAATKMSDEFVSTEHLLLSLVTVECTAKKLLEINGIGETDLLKALQAIRGNSRVTDPSPEGKLQRWISMGSIWSSGLPPASSTRSSAVMGRFVVSFRSSPDARRTTRY